MRVQGEYLQLNLIHFVLALVLEIRALSRTKDEHDDEDEVCSL